MMRPALKIFDGETPLYPPKLRAVASVISMVLALCVFIILAVVQTVPAKILALYAFTACMMFVIIIKKNHLNIYETAIFCFLCIQLLAFAPKPGEMNSLVATSYLLSYRYGVSSRSFAATLVDFLCGGRFISVYFVWHFIFCVTVFLLFLLSFYLGLIIQRSAAKTKPFVLCASLLFLTCFTAPSAYFDRSNFGRVEIFGFIFAIGVLLVIKKPVLRWIIPLFALFVLSTHLILVFFYIPFIILILLYELLTKEMKDKSGMVLLIVTAVVVIVAFLLYLSFHEKTFVFTDAYSLMEYLQSKSDLNFNDSWLHLTLFASLQEHLDGWKDRVNLVFTGHASIIINIPFLAAFTFFWVKCFWHETKKPMKFFYVLPVLLLCYHAAAFFMFIDFGRWMIMIMNIQFLFLFYSLHTRNETVIAIVEKTAPFINKNRFIFIFALACTLMASLGTLDYLTPSHGSMRFFKPLFMILEKYR